MDKKLPTRPLLYGRLDGEVGQLHPVDPPTVRRGSSRLFLGSEDSQWQPAQPSKDVANALPAVPQADGADDFVDGEDETPEAERERRIAEMEEHLYDRLEAKRYGY